MKERNNELKRDLELYFCLSLICDADGNNERNIKFDLLSFNEDTLFERMKGNTIEFVNI